ncbi:lasso peptide biosynthesis protein [Pyxidicoccus parkwayensis]|uniref:Lasso peptide biosynthesis protein n=1 Tax=Pyxidicoccus parkwayensis TaxID=2813578 RepID=A0ABX7NX47_9BACT|nr:lasso peptide biosynthesis protein [Pyxidicoccus parkwaysis]QSQ22959.1 lasso peptide biosynthesis protein [Pyxidicoccus parkwaysis]
MAALLAFLLLALPAKPANPDEVGGLHPPREETRFVFAWRGVPVGTVTLTLEGGRFTYSSRHLHTRDGQPGERRREVTLEVDGAGRVRGAEQGRASSAERARDGRGAVSEVFPQALWLWRGPPPVGCVTAREELSGLEGPHCVTRVEGSRVEGTLLGSPFRASYGEKGRLETLDVGDSRFTVAAPGTRLRSPPELFAQGLPVEGTHGALALEPPLEVSARLEGMTPWDAGAARALSARVHAAFTDKAPGAADWNENGEGEAGGCLAHALRFAARARERGVKVALVHGLLVVDGGPARPHAWVRVALAKGGTLDLDPTSLDAVRPDTHLPLALEEARGPALEAGRRWLELLRGAHRVVRRP